MVGCVTGGRFSAIFHAHYQLNPGSGFAGSGVTTGRCVVPRGGINFTVPFSPGWAV